MRATNYTQFRHGIHPLPDWPRVCKNLCAAVMILLVVHCRTTSDCGRYYRLAWNRRWFVCSFSSSPLLVGMRAQVDRSRPHEVGRATGSDVHPFFPFEMQLQGRKSHFWPLGKAFCSFLFFSLLPFFLALKSAYSGTCLLSVGRKARPTRETKRRDQ